MRAVALVDEASDPAVIDLPVPVAAAGEVLVRVAASSVNGFDVAVAAGYLVGMMEHVYPVVLGKDFAGTVLALGHGVDAFEVGDEVFGVLMKPVLADGTLGELVTVNASYGITRRPDRVDVTTAGALGLAGAAALGVMAALHPRPGDRVLVVGATGGVGALLTQCAAAAGARVIATARPGAEADFVRANGASDVVDPEADLVAQVGRLVPGGVDAIAHLAGDPSTLASLLAPHGRIASTNGFGADQHPAAIAVMANPDAETLDRLAADVVAGALVVPVDRTVTLDEAPAAITAFPAGTLGKFAVRIG